jgi:hypothetical protein
MDLGKLIGLSVESRKYWGKIPEYQGDERVKTYKIFV